LMREGGRTQPFNHTMRYPDAYVPRQLTFEIGGRMNYAGQETEALDEASVMAAIEACSAAQVEAIGVCLLWSIANPDHEAQVGALLAAHLPGVPFSLSHQLNPTLREYRRASSTCIDASLKPLMADYLGSLAGRLSDAGYRGEVYVASSQGGMMQAADLAQAPIYVLNSGPSMAPVSGRYYGAREDASRPVIVADTGGTTYDVSLVRDGLIPMTREMWVGEPYLGHMTGFPSVDVKSVGAGGGSIARVDSGGILHVGPDSAGAVPGPACYSHGGKNPTLTDACVVLGYLDPDYFLGGTMAIDPQRAADAIQHTVAAPLGISLEEAAWAIAMLATENMAQAIIDITVNQGIDPAQAVLIGGGGAAGLNSTFISKRLNCAQLVIPEVGAALSAAGALMTDLSAEFSLTRFFTTSAFDMDAANTALDTLRAQCDAFRARSGDRVIDYSVLLKVEARYPRQGWDIELPLPVQRFDSTADIEALKQAFHETHDRIFAVRDDASEIEVVSWTAVAKC
ncbi:MAG: hydantoinase/oxoprolinase family protein, partial [Pseudomonadota bacterium]